MINTTNLPHVGSLQRYNFLPALIMLLIKIKHTQIPLKTGRKLYVSILLKQDLKNCR